MAARGRSMDNGWLQEGIIRGSMLGKTMLPSDEELGKKDDDHRFVPARRSSWSIWKHSFRWRRRRMLLVLAGLFLVYMLLWRTGKNMHGLEDRPRSSWTRPITSSYYKPPYRDDDDEEPTGPPPGTPKPKHGDAPPHTYDGQIRFFRLASTLRSSASHMGGYEKRNRNVLFAMSSLKSASTLLPMICDMAKWSRNHVHAAFMGREDIPLDDLLDINGIDKITCPAVWHDARPDYSEYSSDTRVESAVTGAMSHINSFLHPQAVIMDGSPTEDASFVRGIRSKTTLLDIALLEIPRDRSEDLTWLTRLDAGSLRQWHVPTVDVLIQVPPGSSSVLRLLKSIKEADYSGLEPPRIILELPADLDESVKQHVASFKWPPHNDKTLAGSGLTIRRRIMNPRITQEDAAIRFLELFYPTSTTSHVLLLSPQAQLSPQYFHFIKYALLEYKYSTFGADDGTNLMGVSLELPNVLLDGKRTLIPPTITDMHTDRYKQLYPDTRTAPFLWQAPNSHATLFFGDKWAELHSFLSNRIVKHQQSTKSSPRPKLVAKTLPSWTEYMLEFMRARGYSLLYPAMMSNALVSIHNELYHAPEEFNQASSEAYKESKATSTDVEEPFLRAQAIPQKPHNAEPPVIPGSTPLHLALPFSGDLPEVPHLPQLLYDGTKINPTMVTNNAADYANEFRKEVGGCTVPQGRHRKIVAGVANDLFCFGDEDADDWVDDASKEIEAVDALDDDTYTKLAIDASHTLPRTASTAKMKMSTTSAIESNAI